MQNLWEDSTGIDSAQHAVKRKARRQGNRTLTEAVTLTALRSWLLHDYVVPYCRSLAAARIFSRCFWIDGLGETRHVSSILQDVSEAARELSAERKPIMLRALTLKPGGSRGEVTPFVLPAQSGSINADWSTIAPFLLDALDQAAAIFLLNPLASASAPPSASSPKQGQLPFYSHNEFAPLYTRTAPTEVCLFFSHAQLEKRLLPALRTLEGAAAFTALLRSDRWKALLANQSQPPQHDAAELVGLFQAVMKQHFLAAPRFAFPICSRPATVEDAPYTLLFATRRQDSLVCMNDALCGYRRRLEEESYRGLLNEGWFRERQRARLAGEMQALVERVLHAGRDQATRRWPDLRQLLLLEHFGDYLVSDYDTCINRLLEIGDVRCEWRQRHNQPSGEKQRIPGNEDVLYWINRP